MAEPHAASSLFGETNARHVEHKAAKLGRPGPTQFRRIAQTILDGPDSIHVRRHVTDYKRLSDFGRVLFISRYGIGRVTTWAIYIEESNQPEDHIPGYVLRHATWDRATASKLQSWKKGETPYVEAVTLYLTDESCEPVARALQALDSLLLAGVAIEPGVEREESTWATLSLERALESAIIKSSWGWNWSTAQCEAAMFVVTAAIEEAIRQHPLDQVQQIEAMTMMFDSPTQEARELLA